MFTRADVEDADKFAKMVAKARLDLSVTEWLEFHRLLVRYNQLVRKMADNQFEVVAVYEPEAASAT